VTLRRAASGAGIYVCLLDCLGRDSRSEPLGSAHDLEIRSNRCLTLSLAMDQIAGRTISKSRSRAPLTEYLPIMVRSTSIVLARATRQDTNAVCIGT
jgi:hypothetical protein